jgi:hypothetical protein
LKRPSTAQNAWTVAVDSLVRANKEQKSLEN